MTAITEHPSVCIGVYVSAQPEQLHATLAALCAHTPPTARLVLLPDGPDAATRAALAQLAALPQLGTAQAQGTAACFNRLAATSDEAVIVLLHSGALVGPGWLERLLAALASDSHYGLAGPASNRGAAWQAIFPDTSADSDAIADSARAAARRFGSSMRVVEPPAALDTFCLVATRRMLNSVGPADESCGLDLCWARDYAARAAQAGFRSGLVAGAYVHRLSAPPARRLATARQREVGQQRVAPRRPMPTVAGQPPAHVADRPLRAPLRPAEPLVSCIMPTHNRPAYMQQAMHYFQQQSYPQRELLIIDDGDADQQGNIPADRRIRYLHLPERQSIGAKRNRACALAQGDYIAQWDDDDWYGPERLRSQLTPLLAGQADITAFVTDLFFDLDRWAFWRCTPQLHRRMFVEDVHGGTLVYRRQVWEQLARYPDRSLAEDAALLRQALRYGARLQRLNGAGHFIYLRHGQNSWRFACGQQTDPGGWQQVPEPATLAADRSFYLSRQATSPAQPLVAPAVASSNLLVSCLMPTANRRAFVPLAIRAFLRQDYAHAELLILDDGENSVADLVPTHPRIRYVRLAERMVLGAKRNLACELAQGDLLCHWDDDDWHAPQRLRVQVATLVERGASVCGVAQLLYYDLVRQRAWCYRHPAPSGGWVAGNSLCYRREAWQHNPFPPLALGEDTRFIWKVPRAHIAVLPDQRFLVGLIHGHNTAPKQTHGACWHPRPPAEVEALLGDDLVAYQYTPFR
ncbi:MAG: glycosyltransferase [Chloroflexaceae bacterium]|jgi:glycosyltransferase involved in cell wall biosynthesis|nr:glycosyltransferase [Chloroflexaceae bacterium]